MCRPKESKGLGFRKIFVRNNALLGKWLWRFLMKSYALWHMVTLNIYGTHSNGWDTNILVRCHIGALGKSLLRIFKNIPRTFVSWWVMRENSILGTLIVEESTTTFTIFKSL